MKIVFMGTPEFSVSFLDILIKQGHEVVAVVTQPDRPAGRGRKLTPPPVKLAALEHGLPVLQPENLKAAEFIAELKAFEADLSVVVAFSILPRTALEATRLGALNMHGSLLPKYRGAAPIQWAVANGDKQTGATVFLLDEKMDHGPVLCRKTLDILPADTAQDVFNKMVPLGCDAVIEAVSMLESGDYNPEAQNHAVASPAPKLSKDDGFLEFTGDAQTIYNRFRGFFPWPGTWGNFRSKVLRIHAMELLADKVTSKKPGQMWLEDDDTLILQCGQGCLRITEIQVQGKKRMVVGDFIRGLQDPEDLLLNTKD